MPAKRFPPWRPRACWRFHRRRADPSGAWLASGGDDRGIKLWNIATGELRNLPGGEMPTYRLIWSADGKQLIEAGFEDKIRVYDVVQGTIAREFEAPSADIRALEF